MVEGATRVEAGILQHESVEADGDQAQQDCRGQDSKNTRKFAPHAAVPRRLR